MSDINVDLGGGSRASIIIRGLDDRTKKLLALRAKRHGRSMEAEARELIEVRVIILDTNVVSEIFRPSPEPRVAE